MTLKALKFLKLKYTLLASAVLITGCILNGPAYISKVDQSKIVIEYYLSCFIKFQIFHLIYTVIRYTTQIQCQQEISKAATDKLDQSQLEE